MGNVVGTRAALHCTTRPDELVWLTKLRKEAVQCLGFFLEDKFGVTPVIVRPPTPAVRLPSGVKFTYLIPSCIFSHA